MRGNARNALTVSMEGKISDGQPRTFGSLAVGTGRRSSFSPQSASGFPDFPESKVTGSPTSSVSPNKINGDAEQSFVSRPRIRSTVSSSSLTHRSRTGSLLGDVSRLRGIIGSASTGPLQSIDVIAEKDCKETLSFVPTCVVEPHGEVQTKNIEERTTRKILFLFDSNERFLLLTAKVVCRRLKEGHCLLYASNSATAMLALQNTSATSPKSDEDEGTSLVNQTVRVMWKENGVLQRTKIPVRPGLASGVACVILKYDEHATGDLSPRKSLHRSPGESLLSSMARRKIAIPVVACTRDGSRQSIQNAVMANGKIEGIGQSNSNATTIVISVLDHTAMARSIEKQLQHCCPWALVPIKSTHERMDH